MVEALPDPSPLSRDVCWWQGGRQQPSDQVSERWTGLPGELVSSLGKSDREWKGGAGQWVVEKQMPTLSFTSR